MAITGILNITIISVRLQPSASAAEEHFAVVRCGKQEFATPKVRDNHFRSKTYTFNLKDEVETTNVTVDVFVVKQNVNVLTGSTRVPLCKIVERKLGASTYNLLKLDQSQSGTIDVEFEFISTVKKNFEPTYVNPTTKASARDINPQPPKGYPQQSSSLENVKGFDTNLDKNETKERGLHGLGRNSYGWAPHQFGHSSGAYSPPCHIYSCEDFPATYPAYIGHFDYSCGYGYGGNYYGEEFLHGRYGYGHDYGHHGHGHGHGHHGYHTGPPFYDSYSTHGSHHHHHHC